MELLNQALLDAAERNARFSVQQSEFHVLIRVGQQDPGVMICVRSADKNISKMEQPRTKRSVIGNSVQQRNLPFPSDFTKAMCPPRKTNLLMAQDHD
jgi:hypothetical protein